MPNIEDIRIESDERGFEMYLCVDEEPEVDENGWFRVNIQAVADKLAQEVHTNIDPWLAEAASVRRIFECGAGEIDESAGAYDLNDPKHPRYHSVHADPWDNRDKLALAKEIGEGWGRVLGGGKP